MTPKLYERVVEIYERIEALEETKKHIADKSKHRLYFAYKCVDEFRCCADWSMLPIADLLDKHDRMIRQEIDDEIERLNKEIAEL